MSKNYGYTMERRNIPPTLQKVLNMDIQLTKQFVSFMLNFVPLRSLKTHCRFLEYSCHGVVWIVCWIAFCWLIDNPNWYQMQVNMIIGLLIDIVCVACLKAATRRRRPSANDDPLCIGPDKFSFPSGHASRAVFIACFFVFLHPITIFFWPPLMAWTASVCLSRLLMYRHHILDVCGGIVLGVVEAMLMAILWMEKDTANWLMSWVADDHLPGGVEV